MINEKEELVEETNEEERKEGSQEVPSGLHSVTSWSQMVCINYPPSERQRKEEQER